MNRNEALQAILATHGKFFSVQFIKRSTGKLREMNCRLGVHKHLVHERTMTDYNGQLTQVAHDSRTNLIYVWEPVKGYRSFGLETIVRLKTAGEWIDVAD